MKPYKIKAPNCALFSVAHAVYFNWFIAAYTEQYFRYYIFQGKI